ncbi:hypothetical protein [Nonomuraea sp. NPDC049709]
MRDAKEHYRALVAEWFTGPVCLTGERLDGDWLNRGHRWLTWEEWD